MNLDLFPYDNLDVSEPILNMGQGLRFIDLFAGIGGFHLALSALGAQCVFASEKDSHARVTYEANFNTQNFDFNNDIRKVSPDTIPDHEILCAGFPCQPFSQAGLKKGFEDGKDSERGNLFFCIVDILEAKKPISFILENVRHLVNHDGGKTFKTILELLNQAGYDVYYEILKASDYNIPQHRPRVFLVGFRKDISKSIQFRFPQKKLLTYTMSDIFGEPCERDVGFTLRVGGKGSNIDDRRNWEFYRVSGEVRRIGILEAKRMMGLPETFKFPVSKTQAMKQLGNSVCVEVVKQVAIQVIQNLKDHHKVIGENMSIKRNKGELSEIYALCKLIQQQYVSYGDQQANETQSSIQVIKLYMDTSLINLSSSVLQIFENNKKIKEIKLEEFISEKDLKEMFEVICGGKATFSNELIDQKIELLGLQKSKGTSYEKADLIISFIDDGQQFDEQGTSVKSFLGNAPTLLNASQATNFIFKIHDLDLDKIDEINNINTSSKIKDRILAIEKNGGRFEFLECENETYENTLRKVDSKMPEILADALLCFFKKRFGSNLSDYIQTIANSNSVDQIEFRLKDFIKYTMLGIFPTQEWDGKLSANGVLLVKQDGNLIFYHTNKEHVLKEFFYRNTFFDTPSSTRHRFGSIYKENGQFYFKLNLQLRLKWVN